jgi:RNA polymerase sigma-70 factor (ECF subfamily)
MGYCTIREVIATQSDLDIVRSVKQGNANAFGELIERYESKLTRYLKRFLQDEDAIADVLQDTLIKAYIHIQSFNEGYTFSSWVYRIAHNEAINAIKKKKSIPFSWFEPETLLPYFAYDDKIEQVLDQEVLKKDLEKVLAKLSPSYREILILFFFEELSYKEIALVLKIPISSVGVRINRAKKKVEGIVQIEQTTIYDHS